MENICKFEYDLRSEILTARITSGNTTYIASKPCGVSEIEIKKKKLLELVAETTGVNLENGN